MDKLFKTRTLVAAVNQIKPVPTSILDLVFSRKSPQLSDLFAWDVSADAERVLSAISVAAEAQVANLAGRTTVTCQAPRFAEKRLLAAADLNAMRAFGSERELEMLQARIGQELAEMKRKIDLTREFMAAKALSGQVVDATGRVLVDFNFTAEQKPVLTGTNLWTDAGSDPLVNIRAWKKRIGQALGNVTRWVAFCSSTTMDALIGNTKALELLKYTMGQSLAKEGRVADMAGVEIHEYYGSYLDSNNTRQDLIPAGFFVLIGISGDQAAELTAPVVDFDSDAGVGSGKAGEFFFSKSWKVDDPSGRWIKVEARPLPVLLRPDAVVYAKVA